VEGPTGKKVGRPRTDREVVEEDVTTSTAKVRDFYCYLVGSCCQLPVRSVVITHRHISPSRSVCRRLPTQGRAHEAGHMLFPSVRNRDGLPPDGGGVDV